ncbi:MAG: MarC family protein [Dehalococcoidia bacterium]|nr:MarC family protein [Dehalococcoidia bacterium]
MSQWAKEFVLIFVPLFIAIDAIATLPIVLTLQRDMNSRERRKMVHLAIATASVLGVIFLIIGKLVLRLLDIKVGHFAIAGGLVLLALALRDLVMGHMVEETPERDEMLAVVPLGTPLTVGPATLTTLLLLSDEYSTWSVLLPLAVNLALAWAIFQQGETVTRILGQGGIRGVAKVMSLLLAAIAVRMIFRGIGLI